jgi:hypothetical protein
MTGGESLSQRKYGDRPSFGVAEVLVDWATFMGAYGRLKRYGIPIARPHRILPHAVVRRAAIFPFPRKQATRRQKGSLVSRSGTELAISCVDRCSLRSWGTNHEVNLHHRREVT